jgi:hypothetical protein
MRAPIFHRILRLRGAMSFSPLNGDGMRSVLRKFPQTRNLTLHSFKRGAADVLIHEVAEGRLDVELLPRLLKHKHRQQELPDVTIGCVSNWAREGRSHKRGNPSSLRPNARRAVTRRTTAEEDDVLADQPRQRLFSLLRELEVAHRNLMSQRR